MEEIRKIAKFLGVPENEELFKAIHDKTQFEKMKVAKSYESEQMKKATENMMKNSDFSLPEKIEPFRNGFNLFRKGKFTFG